jgi:ElaA protein
MEVTLNHLQSIYGSVPIKISAQSYLIQFYQKFGFHSVGEEYLEDDIPHTAMIRS